MKTSLMNGKFILRTKNMKGKNEMKNSKYARIIILVLSLALLIGAAIAISASAAETKAKGTFEGISVVYTDKVALRVIVNATPEEITGGTVVVSYELNGEKKNASYYKTDDEGNVWVITEGIAAYDLTQTVTFSSTVNNTAVESGRTCSVAQFVYAMLYTNTQLTDEYKTLYNTLLAYGEAAQVAFKKNTENLATKSTIAYTKNSDVTVNGGTYAFTAGTSLKVTPVYNKEITSGKITGWNIIDDGTEKTAGLTFTASGVVEIVSPIIHTHEDANNDHICDADICDEIIGEHTFTNGICSCGLIDNILVGKTQKISSATKDNIYSANFGYDKMHDGSLSSRYSSKLNGGAVTVSFDLADVYSLSELSFLLYEYDTAGFGKFGSSIDIKYKYVSGEAWRDFDTITLDESMVVEKDGKYWLTIDLGDIQATAIYFSIPEHGSEGYTTFYEVECSGRQNVLANKTFEPTEDALASVLAATWWKGSGYEGLTDGIRNADNATGRFSTVMETTGMMDATIDLGGSYKLYNLKFYTYDPANGTAYNSLGKDLLIQVYANGAWTDVVTCANNADIVKHLVVNEGTYNDYLTFKLDGVIAEKIRIYISGSVSKNGTTYEEIACIGTPVTPVNILEGKEFVPTEEASASVLTAGWWKGGGYEDLTDGIKTADNEPGRFSTVMALTGMMDATIDLGATYELHTLKIFTYDPSATNAGSVGADLLIQVYANGEWVDVVTCADNAAIMAKLVVNEGTYNDYLNFDLGGIKGEKIRIFISASASGSGTSFEEIECIGY